MPSQLIRLFDDAEFNTVFGAATREQKEQLSDALGKDVTSLRIRMRRTQVELDILKGRLLRQFPNFKSAIRVIFDQLYLSSLSESKGSYFKPLLLVGPPGIGKTLFARALGEGLDTGFQHFDMSTSTSSMHFSGSSPRWGNAGLGVITKMLLTSKVANSVLMLDEVDKVNANAMTTNGRSEDPTKMLISLLETHSARHWKDEYAGFEVDASHLMIIGTANHPEFMPDYLLSRFNVVNVGKPSAEQMQAIAGFAYKDLVKELELVTIMKQDLPAESARTLNDNIEDLRALKRVLFTAMSHASAMGLTEVLPTHIESSVAENQRDRKPKRRPIGFIH